MGNTEPLVSVIMPVYNGQKYVENAIESVIKQSYRNLELICVDDGSTDSTYSILEKCAHNYSQIKLIRQHNMRQTAARINGLEIASGNYAAFIDADDWWEESFLKNYMDAMLKKDADIVIGGCWIDNENNHEKKLNNIEDGCYDTEELLKSFYARMLHYKGFYTFGILPYMCTKVFKKELILEALKQVDKRVFDGEDVAACMGCMTMCSKIVVISDTSYHYVQVSESMTKQKGNDFYENVSLLYLNMKSIFQKSTYHEFLLPQLDQYMRYMIWMKAPYAFQNNNIVRFPFEKIPRYSDIVLYGAGKIGKEYYKQLVDSKYANNILWCDKNPSNKEISLPEMIFKEKYDYIVVAIKDENVIAEVVDYLCANGVDKERIIY